MTADRLRALGGLKFFAPKSILEELRRIEVSLVEQEIPDRVRSLRTNKLKREREMRDAAIFCHGMSGVQGVSVLFAPVEEQDFDFVASWIQDGTQHIVPVQLKELVPEHLNSNACLSDLLAGLNVYCGSPDLTVVIKVNREGSFDPSSVEVPAGLQIRSLWVFGALSADQSEWAIWGDFMNPGVPIGARFSYPKPIGLVFG